ncbi:serine/threonine protein phosphatase [Myxococcus stipitatus DSM 14675]|uniref:Serine/threonine protein phosphatase n=1 Tax=Myxococcus stipitatus (strain DSM 14675 / JCM 12634 / Mx s8) TaxID=1278073 RepID=L7U780_MYXSD|nr:PP2C family serine/threonine-protein phosphatase [Myxococcus stipitatus]AGC43705.1 serine/threonine protein phosphatase [Myxococcus stipitatus DSM 14675]
MWKILKDSIAGTSHQDTGTPCQDSNEARSTQPQDEDFLVLACADGAGSAEFSQIGSSLACEYFVARACEHLQAGVTMKDLDEATLLGWFHSVHEALSVEAQRRELLPRQLACTLLVAIIGEHSAIFAQVGDGAIVIREDNEYRAVFWPQAGEYLNTTNFITEPHFEKSFMCERREQIEEVALLTDGLQMLALNFAAKGVHQPFFAPMFEMLRSAPAHEELIVPFRRFLDSPNVNARTDDDKTLILATRRNGHAAPTPR